VSAQRWFKGPFKAQFAQPSQYRGPHESLWMLDPAAQHRCRRRILQFGETVRGCGTHRFVCIEQRAAQGFDNLLLFPRREHTRRFEPDLRGRIVAQGGNQCRQQFDFFEVSDVEQRDAPHGGVFIGKTREQCEALRVRRIEGWNDDGRHGHGSGIRTG
jgi:hypothetical protein